jgi:hypothetical protein
MNTAALKIFQHLALNLFNIRKIIPRNLWQQRFIKVLATKEGKLSIGNI